MRRQHKTQSNLLIFLVLVMGFATMLPAISHAQGEVDLGATTVSRYLWRGIQLDNGVNFQPYMMYYTSNFEVGVTSSMSLTNDFNEIYFWAAYKVNTSLVDMKFYVADFYYQYDGADFFSFKTVERDGVEGDHYVEGYVEFTSENSPLKLLFSSSIWNDPDMSMYAEVSYAKTLANGVESNFSLGGSLKKSTRWYYTDNAGIVNISYELSKSVQMTPDFALPVTVTSIFNPAGKAFYVVLGISI